MTALTLSAETRLNAVNISLPGGNIRLPDFFSESKKSLSFFM
jgi:hypothetical protein